MKSVITRVFSSSTRASTISAMSMSASLPSVTRARTPMPRPWARLNRFTAMPPEWLTRVTVPAVHR